MKKVLTFILLAVCYLQSVQAQVAKKVIVEHFTNTKCGICASRNPGFYKNLSNFPQVLHLSIHPSSPYSTCLLSQQANPDNDARTNYYGVYGGTPRLVIQGSVISANADYNSANLFSPLINSTSPLEIEIDQYKYGADSIRAKITITAVAANSLPTMRLFVALAEDTVFYKGSNNEPQHYDVFRASMFGATGTTVDVPTTIGESVVYQATIPGKTIWNMDRIYTLAILQNTTSKEVIQAEAASPKDNKTTAVQSVDSPADFNIFPNPVSESLTISLEKDIPAEITLFSINGEQIVKKAFRSTTTLPVNQLIKGLYIVEVLTLEGKITKKVIVE